MMTIDQNDANMSSIKDPESGVKLRSRFFAQKSATRFPQQKSSSSLVMTNEMILSRQIAKMHEMPKKKNTPRQT